ncbi:MAG: TetR/AcrR family transcriptional regulator [Deltaproteobacteria bacterium]|nr:TetR/AcrR family transcriptional regulator [Deltaproteobacteria bacterium]
MPSELPSQTRERILEGAVQAVARHGVTKLELIDVSDAAGVSRGTLYRYFSNRKELLKSVAARETYRFWQGGLKALQDAPEDEERVRLLVFYATRYVREHAALQRMLETEPALVLRALQDQFPVIKTELHQLMAPLLEDMQPVRAGVVTVDQLIDWWTRLLCSAFLLPSPDLEQMLQGLEAMYRLLTVQPAVDFGADEPCRVSGSVGEGTVAKAS